MKNSIALAGIVFCFLWGMGCAQKEIYLFYPGTGSFRSDYEPLRHQDPKPTAALPAPFSGESLGPDKSSSDLSAPKAFSGLGLIEHKKKSLAAASPTVERTLEATHQLPDPTQVGGKSQNFRKKGTWNPVSKERKLQNSPGSGGFFLSLLGVGLFLLSILLLNNAAVFGAIIFLLSFIAFLTGTIISRREISEAKKAADPNMGKGLSTGGFVLGLIGSIISLIIIIAVASYGSGQ